MRGAVPPLRQYVFMAWCLVKHRDNFTSFTFTKRFMVQLILLQKLSALTEVNLGRGVKQWK
jgi:hypothetical protein